MRYPSSMSTSQSASESLPPDTATRIGSSRANIRCVWIASRDLPREELDEVRRAERRVVAAQLERGRALRTSGTSDTGSLPTGLSPDTTGLPPDTTGPPDMTGRTSRTSSPPTTVSLVTSSSPRITSTVPARISSSRSNSFTRRVPLTSISRRGLRRMTFMEQAEYRRSRAREPGRCLQGAELAQVVGIMVGLELHHCARSSSPNRGGTIGARAGRPCQTLDGLATTFRASR